MQPFLNLTRNGKATSEGYSGASLGVWDLHPAILSFLSNRENRIEFEKVILDFIGSGIFADFQRRLRAAAAVVKSSPPALQIEPPLKNHEELEWTIEGQLSLIDDQDNFYLGDSIRKLIKKTPLLYASGGDGSWTIFNRLPFHIFFDSTTSNCEYQGNRSILGPSSRSYSVKSADVNLTQISKLYSQNKGKDTGSSPLCTVDVDPSLLSFSLADGSLITLEALPQSDPTAGNNKASKSKQTSEPVIDLTKTSERSDLHISECFRAYVETFEDLRAAYDLVSSTVSIQNWGRTHLISFGQEEGRIPKLSSPCDTTLGTYLNNHTAVLSFLDSENSSTHSRTRFLLVLGDKLNWNEKALPIYSADGVTIRNLQTSTILRDASKNERSLSKSASDIFAELLTRLTTTINQKSIIFDIVIPRSNNPQYYRVTEASVRAAVSGNIEQLFILHAKESIVPPLGERLPAAPQKAISEVEDIRLLAQPINSVVFIKKDQELVLGPNDRLEFGPKGVIFVEGLLSIRGSEEHPVRLTATEDSWGGIILLGSNRDNIIEHADISKVKGWEPFLGGITAINASLRIVNSSIHNFDSEDAINAHHSRLEIISSTIEHSASDCVDADFSYGEIIETNVRNCGGDGLDMNHSYFFMSQNTLESNADKGLSCGEKSTCAFQDNILRNNDVDIAVKDASILIANQNQFIESNTGIATFTKKPWYSPPYVVESNNRFSGTDVRRIDLGFFRY